MIRGYAKSVSSYPFIAPHIVRQHLLPTKGNSPLRAPKQTLLSVELENRCEFEGAIREKRGALPILTIPKLSFILMAKVKTFFQENLWIYTEYRFSQFA